MSNIVAQNPIRFTLDNLKSGAYSLIIAKHGNELDLTNASAVTGFRLTYSQPENTQIAVAFNTGSSWFKLNTSGQAVNLATQGLTYESLLDEGNSVSELSKISSIPAFLNKKVRVAIALSSQYPDDAVPSFGIGVKCTRNNQVTKTIEYSPIYALNENSQIISAIANSSVSNNGSIAIEGCINESGTWQSLTSLAGKEAKNIQFRAAMNAPVINSSTVNLDDVKVIYSEGGGIMSGANTSEIISTTHNWYKPVKHVRVRVKHAPFKYSGMKVYAAFRGQPKEVLQESLGTGDGKSHTYQLKQAKRVKFDSVKLYFDNEQYFGQFDVNGEVGRITCAAPAGQAITASYEYDWADEEWKELALTRHTSKLEYDESEYYLRNLEENKTVCAVKIVLNMQTGKISNESIGKGTGSAQTYKLSHKVKDGVISITANNAALSKNNYYLLSDLDYIKIAAVNGQTLKASYDWISETPEIYEMHAVFSE